MNTATFKSALKTGNVLTRELIRSGFWTAFLTVLFLLFNVSDGLMPDVWKALPFFIVLYWLFFSIGKEVVSSGIKSWIGTTIGRMLVFPVVLLLFYFFYVLLNHQNPLQGTLALVPYLVIFPVMLFLIRRNPVLKIGWPDFTAFVIFLVLTMFIKVDPSGNLPFTGKDFGSVYKMALILIAVYAFGTLRGLDDIGFVPVLNFKYLWTALWVWFVFYLFVVVLGYSIGFIKYIGHESGTNELLYKIGLTLVVTFLNTAIFEELFFRGILQNMLTKRIGQAKTWKIFWLCGIIILIPLAFLVGYTLKGGMQWFPALMVLLIFIAAFLIERAGKNSSGVYTALAITSALFGLVHYHSGAIIYIGFACVAGWAYGYTYLKTKNVFYSAIVHTLVNSSVLIFGLEFVK